MADQFIVRPLVRRMQHIEVLIKCIRAVASAHCSTSYGELFYQGINRLFLSRLILLPCSCPSRYANSPSSFTKFALSVLLFLFVRQALNKLLEVAGNKTTCHGGELVRLLVQCIKKRRLYYSIFINKVLARKCSGKNPIWRSTQCAFV